MRYEDIFSAAGGTPHLRVRSEEAAGARLYIKLEGMNPTGSVKDRGCVAILRDALDSGKLTEGMTLLDASSGNMACAIAFYGRSLGYPARVVANSKLTEDKASFIRYFGAELELVGDFTIDGNRYCRKLADAENGYCFLDQLHNWANPRGSYETLGPEILADFPEVAMVVGSLGSGGSLYGTSKLLKAERPGVKIVAVQSASGTKLPGTGAFDDGDYLTPFIQEGYEAGLFDHTVKIHYRDAVRRTDQLRDQGVFVGLQTGGVLDATLTAVRDLEVEGEVVMISGDSGFKNLQKLLDPWA